MNRTLRKPAVEVMVGLSRTTIERLEKQGKFPRRILLSERAVGWDEGEILKWLEQRKRRA